MAKNARFFLALVVLLRCSAQESEHRIVRAVVGQKVVILSCSSKPPEGVDWEFRSESSTQVSTLFADSRQVNGNKRGYRLQQSGLDEHSLVISNLKSDDAGKYTCTAGAGLGPRTYYTLTVQDEYLLPTSHAVRVASAGQEISLTCPKTTPGDVMWNYQRTEDDDVEHVVVSGVVQSTFNQRIKRDKDSLVFKRIELGDSGTYTCKERDGIGDSHDIKLLVVDSEHHMTKTAKLGSTFVFGCEINDTATPIWTRGKKSDNAVIFSGADVGPSFVDRFSVYASSSNMMSYLINWNVQSEDYSDYRCVTPTRIARAYVLVPERKELTSATSPSSLLPTESVSMATILLSVLVAMLFIAISVIIVMLCICRRKEIGPFNDQSRHGGRRKWWKFRTIATAEIDERNNGTATVTVPPAAATNNENSESPLLPSNAQQVASTAVVTSRLTYRAKKKHVGLQLYTRERGTRQKRTIRKYDKERKPPSYWGRAQDSWWFQRLWNSWHHRGHSVQNTTVLRSFRDAYTSVTAIISSWFRSADIQEYRYSDGCSLSVPLLSQSTRIGLETIGQIHVDNIELPSISFTDEVAGALVSHETSHGVGSKSRRLASVAIHANAEDCHIDHQLASVESPGSSDSVTELVDDIVGVKEDAEMEHVTALARLQHEDHSRDVIDVDGSTQVSKPIPVRHCDEADQVSLAGHSESGCFMKSTDEAIDSELDEITRLHQERTRASDQLGSIDVSETADVVTEVATGTAAVTTDVRSETVVPAVDYSRNTQEYSLSMHSIRYVTETRHVVTSQQWSNVPQRHGMPSGDSDKKKEYTTESITKDVACEDSHDRKTFYRVTETAAVKYANTLNAHYKLEAVEMEHIGHAHQLANMIQFESQSLFSGNTERVVSIWSKLWKEDDKVISPIDKSMFVGNKSKKPDHAMDSVKFGNLSKKSTSTSTSSENPVQAITEMVPDGLHVLILDPEYESSGVADIIIRQRMHVMQAVDFMTLNSIPNIPIALF